MVERDAIYVAYSLFGKDRYISAEEFSKSVRLLAERLDLLDEKSNFLGLVGHDVFFRIAV